MPNSNFEVITDQFLQHGKIIKNFQPATIAGYRAMFALLTKSTEIENLSQLTTELIEQFLYAGRVERNWSACTYRTYLKQIRAFCNWCVKKRLLEKNPTDIIDKPPLEKKLPDYLSPKECEDLLNFAYHFDYRYKSEGVRNRAVIAMMMLAGLRLSEVANLKRLDVNLNEQVITVRQGKWNKDRQVPIASRLLYFLEEYAGQQKHRKSRHISFFLSVARDQPLGAHGIQVMCRALKLKSGIDFNPQKLRHTFATLTYRGSRDIYAVSGLLGHSNIKTTQIYAHLSLDDKRQSVEQHVMNTSEFIGIETGKLQEQN